MRVTRAPTILRRKVRAKKTAKRRSLVKSRVPAPFYYYFANFAEIYIYIHAGAHTRAHAHARTRTRDIGACDPTLAAKCKKRREFP